ncbi:hypothetical protein LguiB_014108 [Lonicera macranthoides]
MNNTTTSTKPHPTLHKLHFSLFEGKYEYIDVMMKNGKIGGEETRLIIDMDFRSQFEYQSNRSSIKKKKKEQQHNNKQEGEADIGQGIVMKTQVYIAAFKWLIMDLEESLSLEDDVSVVHDIGEKCIAGKILAPKKLNFTGVNNILSSAWQVKGNFKISNWGDNIFTVVFDREEDAVRILDNGPWTVMGNTVVVQKWNIKKPLNEEVVDDYQQWRKGKVEEGARARQVATARVSDKEMCSDQNTTLILSAKSVDDGTEEAVQGLVG